MDMETFVAMLFSFIIALVVIRTIAELWSRHLKLRERRLELQSGSYVEAAGRHAERAERLEARVRVLERLATDRGQDLARAIEDLRKEGEPVK
jgi:hypothetical protein